MRNVDTLSSLIILRPRPRDSDWIQSCPPLIWSGASRYDDESRIGWAQERTGPTYSLIAVMEHRDEPGQPAFHEQLVDHVGLLDPGLRPRLTGGCRS